MTIGEKVIKVTEIISMYWNTNSREGDESLIMQRLPGKKKEEFIYYIFASKMKGNHLIKCSCWFVSSPVGPNISKQTQKVLKNTAIKHTAHLRCNGLYTKAARLEAAPSQQSFSVAVARLIILLIIT